MFFIYRIWHLSGKNIYIATPLTICVILLFVDEFAFFVKTCIFSVIEQVQAISWLLYAGFGLSVFVDTFIAGLLSYLLLKSRNGVKRTTSLIHSLTLYTINTGVLISIASLCILTTYATMPHNYIFLAFFIPLSKLFVNSFLATLNIRSKIREGASRKELGSFSLPKPPGSSDGSRSQRLSESMRCNAIKLKKGATKPSGDETSSIEVLVEAKGRPLEEV
ncbi:hypothetical protein SCHPADRAFT_911728 [Schizopora paradoxa]|uniref:DUF6534 domain-containing protein n=1 Tax=Schizopora paradoxa TaxID=27342 RepID=A0A0H2QXD6_9AGAM|nr:hypothetical protein SCHPADRAFT_911728 [Schizopora paradoxa]